jgi:hypothetical protein
MGLVLSVLPRETALVGFSLPYRNPERICHSFTFHIPGVLFVVKVGKNLGSEMPSVCFATNPAHPILIADLSKDIAAVGASIFAKARKSRKLVEYMKGTRKRRGV